MTEFLTSTEITTGVYTIDTSLSPEATLRQVINKVEVTLREYAAIVEAVAKADPVGTMGCPYCNGRWETTLQFSQFCHAPDCLWLRARKVRGYE